MPVWGSCPTWEHVLVAVLISLLPTLCLVTSSSHPQAHWRFPGLGGGAAVWRRPQLSGLALPLGALKLGQH